LNQLPQILKKARQALGLTQEDVAKKLGITQRAYAFYEDENNDKIPKPKRLAQLGEILSIPLNTLLAYYEKEVEENTSIQRKQEPTPETTDTPLPSGNASRTLADYIAMIERYNTTMSAAITAGLINLKEGQQQLKEQIVSSSAALAKLIEAHTVAAPGLSPQGGKRLKKAKEDGKGKDH
jgi:transcriptional regulator with XRE-family HTH domain